jgi:hypothetical protein
METILNVILIITLIIIFWCLQAIIAIKIHIKNYSRTPKNFWDGALLMFLPYVIWCKCFNTKKLSND